MRWRLILLVSPSPCLRVYCNCRMSRNLQPAPGPLQFHTPKGPHRLEAQDTALSRRRQGFESPWGYFSRQTAARAVSWTCVGTDGLVLLFAQPAVVLLDFELVLGQEVVGERLQHLLAAAFGEMAPEFFDDVGDVAFVDGLGRGAVEAIG